MDAVAAVVMKQSLLQQTLAVAAMKQSAAMPQVAAQLLENGAAVPSVADAPSIPAGSTGRVLDILV